MSALTDRIAADTSKFLDVSAFGSRAVLVWGDTTKVLSVIFDENYTGIDQFGSEVANSGPMAIAETAKLEDANGKVPGETEDEATLETNGTTYNVTKAARFGDLTHIFLTRD